MMAARDDTALCSLALEAVTKYAGLWTEVVTLIDARFPSVTYPEAVKRRLEDGR